MSDTSPARIMAKTLVTYMHSGEAIRQAVMDQHGTSPSVASINAMRGQWLRAKERAAKAPYVSRDRNTEYAPAPDESTAQGRACREYRLRIIKEHTRIMRTLEAQGLTVVWK